MKKFNGLFLLPPIFAVCLTAVAASAQAPTVTSTVPESGSLDGSVNRAISATFSTAMDPSTITPSTFTLERIPGIPVSGSVSYIGTTAIFTPASDLLPGFHAATITTGARDLAGTALATDYGWLFLLGSADATLPTVTSTVPSAEATGVPVSSAISVTFTEAMNPFTFTTCSFTLLQGATPVAGIVNYVGTTATFTPASDLAPSATFTAAITTEAHDLAGNALAVDYEWSFTTGVVLDATPPAVTSTVPVVGAIGVPVNSAISATFSEAMNPSTLTTATFTVMRGATPVAGTVSYVGTTATFTPASGLAPFATFTAAIATGAKDLGGNALAGSYEWSFTTGVTPDATPPTVTSTFPADGATGVPVNRTITATFSEAMNPATLTTSTFTVSQGGTPVAGTVTYRGTTATFTPAGGLAPFAAFTATIATGINGAEDLAGNVINSPYIWNFATIPAPAPSPVIHPAGTINNSAGTVNSASYETSVAAGSIAAVFGSNLSIGESYPGVATLLRNSLAGSSFTIGGQVAPLYFASPGQVNLQIPWTLAGLTQAPIQATVDGAASNLQMVSLAPFGPGIFTMDATGTGQGAVLIAPTDQLAAPDHPVHRGEYIAIFCTGLGAVTNQPATGAPALATPLSFTLATPTVTIGGTEAMVSYSGLAPGFAGLYQVNAIVPEGSSAGNAVAVVLSIGGVTSNTVTIAVQ